MLLSDLKKALFTLILFALGLVGLQFVSGPVDTVSAQTSTDFVTTWKTDNPGTSCSSCITIPGSSFYGFNYDIDTNNDGTFDVTGVTDEYTHDFGTPGTYTIRIRGDFTRLNFNNGGDKNKLIAVNQWGNVPWSTMYRAFYRLDNISILATDAPNLSNVTSMDGMFYNSSIQTPDFSNWDVSNVTNMDSMFGFTDNANPNVSGRDVSNVTDMSSMFYNAQAADPDVSSWDVSSVTNMSSMFHGAGVADPDVSSRNVSNVTDMSSMFRSAQVANPNVSNWDVSNVTNMNGLFDGATSADPDVSLWNVSNVTFMSSVFQGTSVANPDVSNWDLRSVTNIGYMFRNTQAADPDVSSWDVSSVTNMRSVFQNAAVANPDVSNWDVSNVTNMYGLFRESNTDPDVSNWDVSNVTYMGYMFEGATLANPDVSNWDVSNVVSMRNMFKDTTQANPDVSNWNVSNVIDMLRMFVDATAANPDVSNWNMSNVTNTAYMFEGATLANPDVSNWDVGNVTNMHRMFRRSSFSVSNYDKALIAWEQLPLLQNNVYFDAYGTQYCLGGDARSSIIANYNWNITDSGEDTNTGTYYLDADEDGYGDPNETIEACGAPTGYVTNNLDCDDTNGEINPDSIWYIDADGDGYGDAGTASIAQCERPTNGFVASELTAVDTDCNDSEGTINPGAVELCDGIDNSCSGVVDDVPAGCSTGKASTISSDEFIYGPTDGDDDSSPDEHGAAQDDQGDSADDALEDSSDDQGDEGNSADPTNDPTNDPTKDTAEDDKEADQTDQNDTNEANTDTDESDQAAQSQTDQQSATPVATYLALRSNTDATCFDPNNQLAYETALEYNILTMSSCPVADMNGTLLRKDAAKIMSNYAINILNKKPNRQKQCVFDDVAQEAPITTGYIETACQLGLMGLQGDGETPLESFTPNDPVNKAQLATILSRLLYGSEHDKSNNTCRWCDHVDALKAAGIIIVTTDLQVDMTKGEAIVMLKKTFEEVEE